METPVSLYLDDGDVRLYHGDALEVLRQLPDGCVDMVATSPPFYGLRDYGTGSWEGGDPDCEHIDQKRTDEQMQTRSRNFGTARGRSEDYLSRKVYFTSECATCGARRVDRQIGLEETPSCGRHGLMRLRSDLTPDQRAYVAQRLLGVESHDE